ncbi:transposase domain-containing protein [Streptomyces zhihengii]
MRQGRCPGHLGELTRIVPFEMVDEVLADTGRTQQRIRDLPRAWWCICCWAGIVPGARMAAGVAAADGGLDGLPTATPTAARWPRPARLGTRPLRHLFDLLRGPAAGLGIAGTRWHGLLVCAIDGTLMAVPDSPRTRPSCQAPLQQWRRGIPLAASDPGRLRNPNRHGRGIRSGHRR